MKDKYLMPKTNEYFWKHKIAMNIARDYANNVDLELAGWLVIRVWECDVKTKAKREDTLRDLYDRITLSSRKPIYNKDIEGIDYDSIAAEPDAPYGKI